MRSLVLLILLFSKPAGALYSWDEEASKGDVRLLLRAFTVFTENEYSSNADNTDSSAGGLARGIVKTKHSDNLDFEFNIYQTFINPALVNQQSGLDKNLDVERSGALELSLSDTEYAHLAIDRMNVRWSSEDLSFRLGRQAINLATTFYFSPNDFFAPFAAQSFYRVYKPGVDAIRAEIASGELSSVNLIGVLGYSASSETDSGWNDNSDPNRTSWLASYLVNMSGFEWGLLAGKAYRKRIVGASLSGELFDWLGIRAEANRSSMLDGEQQIYDNVSIGLEHRWENSLMIQFEQFYHGDGEVETGLYDLRQSYPARRYRAIGISYEFSSLWTTQASIITNLVDTSDLYNVNVVYSLSDESEISFTLSLPDGEKPTGTEVKSEYGVYPRAMNLELRAYF